MIGAKALNSGPNARSCTPTARGLVLLLGYYHGFATAATNILFGNIFGVSGSQLLVLVLLVLSLAITPGAAAQRLSANPRRVAVLSVLFAVVAADGGLIASFEATNVKASAFITSISSATYLLARVVGPAVREKHRHDHDGSARPGKRGEPADLPNAQVSEADQAATVTALDRHVLQGDGAQGAAGPLRLKADN